MNHQIVIIIIASSIPFFLVVILIRNQSILSNAKIKAENKWDAINLLILQKIDLLKQFLGQNNFDPNVQPLISLVNNIETSYLQTDNINQKIKLNNELNNVYNNLQLYIETKNAEQLLEKFQLLSQDLSNLKDKLDYSASFYNENTEKYNNLLAKPINKLIALFCGYHQLEKCLPYHLDNQSITDLQKS